MAEKLRRRRGAALERAILEAAWEELSERGWSGFTIDAVASRSGAAKSVLYRRWGNKVELVEAMLTEARLAGDVPFISSGSLRTDLVRFLESMAAFLATGFGDAVRGVMCEGDRTGQPSIFEDPAIVLSVGATVADAVARGELPRHPPPLAVNLGHSLVLFEFLHTGSPPSPSALVDLVDTVWLRALGAGGDGDRSEAQA